MRIHVLYIGKPRDPHANAMAEEYIKRLQRYVRSSMEEIQPARYDPWIKHPSAAKALLDPNGKTMDSRGFAGWMARAEREARDLVFVTGGAQGLPPGWAARADVLLSLSDMTYAHEVARVMLTEQLYRAFAALRGHPYSK